MTPSFNIALVAALLAGAVSAANTPPTLCEVSDIILDIRGSTLSPPPSNTKPRYLGWLAGTQNYSCENGKYEYVGELAEIIDISCIVPADFSRIFQHDDAISPGNDDEIWAYESSIRRLLGPEAWVIGQVSSDRASNGSYSPHFDFTKDLYRNDPNMYVSTYWRENSTAPSATNADWWYLGRSSGDLADYVYVVYTHGGKAPASCQPGSGVLAVRFFAVGVFYGGKQGSSSSRLSSSGVGNANVLNAAASSVDDSSNIQKLLNYIPAILGLLTLTTIFSLILVILGVLAMCRSRASRVPTRSAAYRPVQLPRAKTPQDGSYHDDLEPYGA